MSARKEIAERATDLISEHGVSRGSSRGPGGELCIIAALNQARRELRIASQEAGQYSYDDKEIAQDAMNAAARELGYKSLVDFSDRAPEEEIILMMKKTAEGL